jgi:hypothetical protein
MIMTRDDVVCVLDNTEFEDSLVPMDYLVHKEEVVSPWISNYEFDEDRGVIKMSAYFEHVGSNIIQLHHNLLGEIPELLIIDTIHGVFEGCQVEWMEYVCHKPIDPYIICEIRPRNVVPWNKELPFDAYNVDPDHFGIHDGGRGGRPLPSMHHGQVGVEGVSIFGGDGSGRGASESREKGMTTLGDKTSSISVKVMRNGNISAKQIIILTGRLWSGQDPADPKILEIMKGRIGFGDRPGKIPGNLNWMFYMTDDDDEVVAVDDDDDVEVRFHWGEDITIRMQTPKMRDVTYVEDGLIFNSDQKKEDDGNEQSSDSTFPYRLYYDGRIVPE